jgi:hypothetical protein
MNNLWRKPMNEQERILEILKEYKFQAGTRYGIEAM